MELFHISFPPSPCIDGVIGEDTRRLEAKYADRLRDEPGLAKWVSYVGNRDVPILRLYRYKEAFAFRFVEQFLARFELTDKDYIFDPFCGMGTTLLASYVLGIPSIGIDRLPVAVFIARTLPLFFDMEPGTLRRTFEDLLARVSRAKPAQVADDVAIMKVAFPEEVL
ncbi:MAG: site-specific DNA-methyltransferase, partial [Armatimonadetes bacterium]|nr:site-specific DNA-methyltransferase [Armatimonadota bacterium]